MPHVQRSYLVVASVVALVLVYLLLNARTLGWPFGIVDTPIVLAQAIQFSPIEYFTQPEAYKFLSFNNFTPLVPLSWDFDYSLFGLSEQAARAHQMVVHLLMLGLAFVTLRQLTRSVPLATLFTFAAMNLPATYSLLDTLVNRHYIEGMIFALGSFLCFLRYDERRSAAWLAASVVLYALAALAKEVYLPLPGLLFFVLGASFRERVLTMLPYAVVLGIYLALRVYMIGGAGGYADASGTASIFDNLPLLGLAGLQIVAMMLAQPLVSIALVLVVLGMLVMELRSRDHDRLFLVAVVLFGLFAPLVMLLPLISAGFVIPRWVFVPSMFMLFYLAYRCARLDNRRFAIALYMVVFASSAFASYQRVVAEEPLFARADGRNYQAIVESGPDTYVVYSGFSQLAAENYSVWNYIARLHTGEWGALPIVHPTQASYHRLSDKTKVVMGRKARKPGFLKSNKALEARVIQGATLTAGGELLTVSLRESLPGKSCTAYLFTPYNGIVFGLPDCTGWTMLRREIFFQLRKAGMRLDDTRLAFWSDDPEHPWRSTPYPLADLLAGADTAR